MRLLRVFGSAFIFGMVCKANNITVNELKYWIMFAIFMTFVIILDSKLFPEIQQKKGS